MIRPILRAALHKLCAAFGSVLTVPLIYGLFVLCFAMTSLILTAQAPEKVTVALVDQCGGPYARRLCDDLLSSAELDVTLFPSVHEAEDALLCGRCEAALTIRDDYDRRILSDDASALINITEAPDAVSGDLLRETVAGLLLSGRSAARAERALTAEGYDSSLLYTYASAFPHARIYRIQTLSAGQSASRAVFGQGYACYEGVVALSLFLLLFTLAVRLSSPFARQVYLRLCAHPRGRGIAFFSDVGALLLSGGILIVPALLFAADRSLRLAALLLCYTVCITGLCLFLSRFSVSGRLDLVGPLAALITSIAGGCFADLSALGGIWRIIPLFTPQGQLIYSLRGAPLLGLLLLLEGLARMLLAALTTRRDWGN